jgi:hypothetical protein
MQRRGFYTICCLITTMGADTKVRLKQMFVHVVISTNLRRGRARADHPATVFYRPVT